MPVIGKLIVTYLFIRLVSQRPHRPLKRCLRAPGGPLKCEFIKFEDLLACYISEPIPVIGKLIAIHLIIRLVCQGPPGTLGGPEKVNLTSLKDCWHVIYKDLMPQASLSCACWANCAHQLKMHVWFFWDVTLLQCFFLAYRLAVAGNACIVLNRLDI